MQRDPETTVREIYAALGEGDVDAVLSRLARHVELRLPDGLPFGGIYQGREQVTHLVDALAEHFEALSSHAERVLAAPPFVVVLGRHVGRTRAGVDVELPSVGVWRFDDGLVDLYKDFTDTAIAVRAIEGAPPA